MKSVNDIPTRRLREYLAAEVLEDHPAYPTWNASEAWTSGDCSGPGPWLYVGRLDLDDAPFEEGEEWEWVVTVEGSATSHGRKLASGRTLFARDAMKAAEAVADLWRKGGMR